MNTSVVGVLHDRLVFNRRAQVLAKILSSLLPPQATVLDVGCGDGTIDALMIKQRPDLSIRGLDALVRPKTKIPVDRFDGEHLPPGDKSFDVVCFVDVLHHTNDPVTLLREARRVARKLVVLKDHTMDGLFAYHTLRLMDWVGNAHHGVALPYNYWPETKWKLAFDEIGLEIEEWRPKVGLYPFPASMVFERGLHFVAALRARPR
jgi:SAM-dependent methyltransferase